MDEQLNEKKEERIVNIETESDKHQTNINSQAPKHESASIKRIISKVKNTRLALYTALNSLRFKKKLKQKTLSQNYASTESAENKIYLPDKTPSTSQYSKDATPRKEGFLNTSIPGFDSMLSKGIPRGISVLLMGGPGCGKTTFGLHLLSEAAKKGEKCLYMSFEEKESQLESHMKNYGFPVEELTASGNLMIKRYDPFKISQSVEALLAEARGELLIKIDKVKQYIPENFNPDIIILDSLSAVSAAFAGRKDGYRIYIEQLFRSLEETGATTFLITENSASLKKSESQVEEFLADGIISFYNLRIKNTRVKAMEILKLRGVNFKKKIVPFEITEGIGFEVYPMEEIFRKN